MLRLAVLGFAVFAGLLVGCGGKEAPDEEDAPRIAPAHSSIGFGCAGAAQRGGDTSALTEDVDALVKEYRENDPDAEFQLAPNGEPTTMRELMNRAYQALSLPGCDPTLARQIDRELE